MNAVAGPDGVNRYAEMAERNRQRQEASQQAERARLEALYGPPLDGEMQLLLEEPHVGHRTHHDLFHGAGSVVCSCGQPVGSFSFILTEELMEVERPDHCRICRAHGVEKVEAPAATHFSVRLDGPVEPGRDRVRSEFREADDQDA